MPEWTIIANHGLVLAYMSKHPRSTAREIASAIKITEWTVRKIIDDLEAAGYIERQRLGRRNTYRINPRSSLRHETVRDVMVGDLLKVLGWRHELNAGTGGEPNKSCSAGCSSLRGALPSGIFRGEKVATSKKRIYHKFEGDCPNK